MKDESSEMRALMDEIDGALKHTMPMDEIMDRRQSDPLLIECHRIQLQAWTKIQEAKSLRAAALEAQQAWFESTKAPGIGYGVLHDDPDDYQDLKVFVEIQMPETTSTEEDVQAIEDLRLRMMDTVQEWLQHKASAGTKTGYVQVEE